MAKIYVIETIGSDNVPRYYDIKNASPLAFDLVNRPGDATHMDLDKARIWRERLQSFPGCDGYHVVMVHVAGRILMTDYGVCPDCGERELKYDMEEDYDNWWQWYFCENCSARYTPDDDEWDAIVDEGVA